jgi:hypothetical protein
MLRVRARTGATCLRHVAWSMLVSPPCGTTRTLVVPIRLRGVAAGDGERERNADLLSWDAEDSSSSAWLSLTLFVPAAANLLIDTDACVQDPRSSLSLSRLCPSCVPFRVTTIKTKRYSPTSSLPFTPSPHRPSLPRGSGQFHSVPSTLFPKLCDRALPATGYRGPGRRAYAHSEPCSRERAGCRWTGRGRVGRREGCMALRYAGLAFFLNMIDSQCSKYLAVLRCSVDISSGR